MTRVWERVSCEKSVLGAKQLSMHVAGMAGARGSGTYDGNKNNLKKTISRFLGTPRSGGSLRSRGNETEHLVHFSFGLSTGHSAVRMV